jgi:membrane-associated phospholipid phosphatase
VVQATTEARGGFGRGAQARFGAAAVLLLAVAVVIGVLVWHANGPTALDHTPYVLTPRMNQRWPFFARLTFPGSPAYVALGAGVIFLIACVRRDWFAAAMCALGPATAAFLVEVVAKPLVDRQKGHAPSYPSGHTTLAAALAALAVVVAYRLGGPRLAAAVALPAACVPLVVSLGVVRLGWHYASDAAGGIALGAGAVLATAVVLSAIWPRMAPLHGQRG